MKVDLENIIGVLVQVVLTISWLCMLVFAIWLLILWVKLTKDSKEHGGLSSRFFPVFVFTPSVLSELGRLERTTFLKVLYVFIVIVIFNLFLLFFGVSWLALEYPENLRQ